MTQKDMPCEQKRLNVEQRLQWLASGFASTMLKYGKYEK
jgi:hypothetical protein